MASQDIDPRLLGLLLMSVKPTQPIPSSFAGQIFRWFRNRHGWPFAQRRLFNILNSESTDFSEVGEEIDAHLRYLADLGMVQPVQPDGDGVRLPLAKWRLSLPDELKHPDQRAPDGGGRGRDGNGNRGPRRGDGDDGDGGGVREVLSHPTLFALPQQEFEGFVQSLFDEPGAQ